METAASGAEKLQFEVEHFQALSRMRLLDSYYQWTLRSFAPYLGQKVMDAGCGIGNFTELLASSAKQVVAVELSPMNIEQLRQRFGSAANVEVVQADLEGDISSLQHRQIDTIVCMDVLEHVERDDLLLSKFREITGPSGTLLIKVPACPWLYGSIDVASSHFRRYSKASLRAVAESAGWKVVQLHYMNVFGVMPYWLKSRVLQRQANFSKTFSPWQLTVLQRTIPIMERFDRMIGPPIGQSLVLVARGDS